MKHLSRYELYLLAKLKENLGKRVGKLSDYSIAKARNYFLQLKEPYDKAKKGEEVSDKIQKNLHDKIIKALDSFAELCIDNVIEAFEAEAFFDKQLSLDDVMPVSDSAETSAPDKEYVLVAYDIIDGDSYRHVEEEMSLADYNNFNGNSNIVNIHIVLQEEV